MRGLRPRRDDGQALVEFALILVPLLVILFSLAQAGFFLATQIGLTNTARDVARHAAATPTDTAAEAAANRNASIVELQTRLPDNVFLYNVGNFNDSSATPPSDVTFCSYQDVDGTYAVRVKVDVQYRHPLFIPFVSLVLDPLDGTSDGRLRVGTTESMRVENLPLGAAPAGMASC